MCPCTPTQLCRTHERLRADLEGVAEVLTHRGKEAADAAFEAVCVFYGPDVVAAHLSRTRTPAA